MFIKLKELHDCKSLNTYFFHKPLAKGRANPLSCMYPTVYPDSFLVGP